MPDFLGGMGSSMLSCLHESASSAFIKGIHRIENGQPDAVGKIGSRNGDFGHE
jgi:hypothetical protein